jgi:ANTAR domain-containing protein/GAF domain-containing protein
MENRLSEGSVDTADYPSTDPEPIVELKDSLAETASALFAAGSLENTLKSTVDLAVAAIDGCDFAGIFTLVDDTISTPVHTDPIVIEVDTLQHRTGEGPCLDAITAGSTFYADDLIDDARWPRFGPLASSLGIRSALAIRLSANGARGALNLYARYPRAFGVVDRGNGHLLATLAGIALSAAETHAAEERRTGELEAGLITREMIGQAQGILMERERITSDQAFDILRRASQHLNVKLRDVAQALVDTGERPETGSSTL